MLEYVRIAIAGYGKHKHKETFILDVWNGANGEAEKQGKRMKRPPEYVVKRATTALLELGNGKRSWVSGKGIFEKTQFKDFKGTNSHGLWPWLKKNDNADVIQEQVSERNKEYKVKDEFYDAMRKVVMGEQ
ncbi:MAG: hypothetical protein WC749_07870 [Dehalococcoidia bacterium]